MLLFITMEFTSAHIHGIILTAAAESEGMDVCWYLFSFGVRLRLNPRSSTGIALPLICCSIFSTFPSLLPLCALLFFLFCSSHQTSPRKALVHRRKNTICVLKIHRFSVKNCIRHALGFIHWDGSFKTLYTRNLYD